MGNIVKCYHICEMLLGCPTYCLLSDRDSEPNSLSSRLKSFGHFTDRNTSVVPVSADPGSTFYGSCVTQ